MSLKGEYHRLKTTEDSEEEEDSPPTHVLLHTTNFAKGSRWNHVENLDEFFEKVYQYQQNNGLAAIALADIMEILQFAFIVSFTTFIVTCLRFRVLWADKVPIVETNMTRDVLFSDLFDLSQLKTIPDSFTLVFFLMMAVLFGVHRSCRAAWRFYKFWEMRNFYIDALKIAPHQLRDCTWLDVVKRLKEAQKDVMINIRKQELTELDIYHRILRFKNYTVAFVNKSILPCKISIPFLGDKLFFTRGLLFNYELLLFWGPGAPFKSSYHLDEQYKSALRKQDLVKKLQFRITVLALVNLLFFPVILLYQVLYSFFSYAEVVKREPGVFGKRSWSLYGKHFFRNFNELDHELDMRLGFAYKSATRYVDTFTSPLLVILAKNVVFFAGSLLGVLVVMTIIQEDLLTAHNLLAIISLLGLTVTVGVLFIPDENTVRCPAQHMAEVLKHVQCMPDLWKEQLPLVEIPRAGDNIDFFRNFIIDVSGVGDVCSSAEINVKKHGHPNWMSGGMTRASQYEQAELEVSHISKNPQWKPNEDETVFISQLKESDSIETNSYASSKNVATVGDLQETVTDRERKEIIFLKKAQEVILVGSWKNRRPPRKRYDEIYITNEKQALWNVTMIVMMLSHVASASLGTTRSIELIPPENYTVFQNDTPAIFNCIGNGFGYGAVVSWTLNGTGYDAVRHAQRGITVVIDPPTKATVLSRLSIPSNSTINNNTQVVCRTSDVTFVNSLTSQPADLTIQGPLDAPKNFFVNIYDTSNTTFLLSWSAPFSLNVTNSTDIFYYTLCTNITIYGCWTIPSDPDCTFPRTCTSSVDFTDPSLNGTNGGQNKTIMDYGDPIQFTFFAVNGAGNGSKTKFIYLLKTESDTGIAASPVETIVRSISISPTLPLETNTQSEISSTVWIAIGLCCGCILIAGVLVTLVIKYSGTKRKRPDMDCCAKPPLNVELCSHATHHEKSTTDTTDQEKKLDGYSEVACSQVISIPAPPDEVHYSDVMPPHNQPVTNRTSCYRVESDSVEDENECDPRWCHQPGSEKQVKTSRIAPGLDLDRKNAAKNVGTASLRILSEDIEQREPHSSDIQTTSHFIVEFPISVQSKIFA